MRPEHYHLQHMQFRRHGITLNYTIPSGVVYHKPDIPYNFNPVLPSLGNRTPHEKSPQNYRGTHINHRENRAMHLDSHLEYDVGLTLKADPNVEVIREQWPSRPYKGADGKQHEHTFDYWVQMRNKQRVAIAVKPFDMMLWSDLLDTLRRLRRAGHFDYADRITFVDEHFANKDAVANAEKVLLARRNRNEEEVLIAKDLVKHLRGSVLFWDLLSIAPVIAHRRTAVWNLIDEGVLRPVKAGRITDFSYLISGNN